MFRKILCATDFSPRSKPAVEQAARWAELCHAQLELLHVLEPVLFTTPEIAATYAEIEASNLRDLEARIAAEAFDLRARVPGTSGRARLGPPAREILAHVEETKPDLVVLGTDGRGAIARAVLGSVADRLLRTCPAPVLLVPCESRGTGVPKRIVVPTDFSPTARGAVTRAVEIADALGGSVTVVHAYQVPAFVERDSGLAKNLRTAMALEVDAEHPDVVAHTNVSTKAREGAAAKVIMATIEDERADLVVMSSTGRGLLSSLLLGGVTDRVVRTSRVPVLVTRERAS